MVNGDILDLSGESDWLVKRSVFAPKPYEWPLLALFSITILLPCIVSSVVNLAKNVSIFMKISTNVFTKKLEF